MDGPDFRELFESAPGLYLVLAVDPPKFTIVAASDNYLRATMTTREGVVGRGLFEVFPDNPDDPNATGVANLRASLERAIQTRQPDTMAVQKYDIRKPDGGGFEERFWSPINTPIIGRDGSIRSIIHRVEDVTEFVRMKEARSAMEIEVVRRAHEIQETNRELRALQRTLEERVEQRTTELRKSEDQLRQAQKLEAIGRLAGGIAHDFNNLLSVILSYCAIIRGDLGEHDPIRAHIEEMDRAGRRAAELTRQLLAFSRQQVVELKVLDMDELLVGLSKMLERLVGEDIELKLLLGNAGRVRADRGQIEQIVMNLAVNSRDALPSGGKLTIQTSDVTLDEAYARDHADVVPGPYVMLAVSDSGIGMDATTQTRVFEPFFTTKEYGKGTGLGLSTVFGIVKRSGGHIWLYSEVGQGTTFKLYFPRVEAKADAFGSPAVQPSPRARGRETILLAEDQEQVRAVAAAILRRGGYHVLEASNPGDALLICEQHPVPIHLLLTDVIMPKMNGRELADRVRAKHSSIKVLFMSGYTDDVILQHGVLDSRVSFIEKPLMPEPLLKKLREVLDG